MSNHKVMVSFTLIIFHSLGCVLRSQVAGAKMIKVYFTSQVPDTMPWKFTPTQREVKVYMECLPPAISISLLTSMMKLVCILL